MEVDFGTLAKFKGMIFLPLRAAIPQHYREERGQRHEPHNCQVYCRSLLRDSSWVPKVSGVRLGGTLPT